MGKLDWLKNRNRGIHLTIRDVDCKDFDVDQMMKDFASMHVEFFSFFCGGYITTYPTELRYQRMSPWLEGRDLTGDIVETAHRCGIKAIAMADLGVMSALASAEHPEWCAVDIEGQPYHVNDEITVASLLGGYQTEYAQTMVEEIVRKYPVDGIKFGGGSYGFQSYGSGLDYNEACRRSFYDRTGKQIPARVDWNDPVWKEFLAWRYEVATARVRDLGEMVKSFDPELLFMGNATCFGDPGWTTRASLDIEEMAPFQDAIQVEAQTRVRLDAKREIPSWNDMHFPAEEANYVSTATDRPAWVVCSYFLAWPWRRNAVPPVEQKVYLAQIAANGGSPMVNLSGGPPKVHEDKRGFRAVRELYGFLKEHRQYYDQDTSAAEVGIVYSQETLVHYGREAPRPRYVDAIRGFEKALREAHIPFDIMSSRQLNAEFLSRYKTLVLANTAILTEEQVDAIRLFVAAGGGLVATYETSLYDAQGHRKDNFALSDVLGATYRGAGTAPLSGSVAGVESCGYWRLTEKHSLTASLDTEVVPADGAYCAVQAAKNAAVPLTLYPPFRVFPEGISYGQIERTDAPMAICSDQTGGRVVYFPTEIDKLALRIAYPDLLDLLASAVEWTGGPPPIHVTGPRSIHTTYRAQKGRRMIHLINFSGGDRFLTELVPVRDLTIELRSDVGTVREGRLLGTGQVLSCQQNDKGAQIIIPQVDDYEVLVLELEGGDQ